MAIKTKKATTNGLRGMTTLDYSELSKVQTVSSSSGVELLIILIVYTFFVTPSSAVTVTLWVKVEVDFVPVPSTLALSSSLVAPIVILSASVVTEYSNISLLNAGLNVSFSIVKPLKYALLLFGMSGSSGSSWSSGVVSCLVTLIVYGNISMPISSLNN